MKRRWGRALSALVAVLTVSFSTGCSWKHERECPTGLRTHCENDGIYSCVDGVNEGDLYQETFQRCGSGKMCLARNGAVECVLSPTRECARSTCSGDTTVVCGATGFVSDEKKCTIEARICAESSSGAACVFPDACPPGKVSFCAPDGNSIYDGCDKGYGYPTDSEACKGCGTPICVDGATSAACAEPPAVAYESRNKWAICSADGNRSLGRKTDTGVYYQCVQDCAASGQRCMPSTGECGYDIACVANELSKCSPDKTSRYSCNTEGMYVEGIGTCGGGSRCVETEYAGKVEALCQ